MAIADARLVAVGGLSAGQVLKSVVGDSISPRNRGMVCRTWALRATAWRSPGSEKTVYAIGGATGVGDTQVTSSAESLKLAPRKPQPASEWRSLPDAPTAG